MLVNWSRTCHYCMSQWYALHKPHKLTHLDRTTGQGYGKDGGSHFKSGPWKCHLELSSMIDMSSSSLQGLIKIRGDRCWRDLTCMDYHYEVCAWGSWVCIRVFVWAQCNTVTAMLVGNACRWCPVVRAFPWPVLCWVVLRDQAKADDLYQLPAIFNWIKQTTLLSIFPYLLSHAIGSTAPVWLAVDRQVLPQARYSP